MTMNIRASLKIFTSTRIDYPSMGQKYDPCYNPTECELSLHVHRHILADFQTHALRLSIDSILAEDKEYIYRPLDVCQNCTSCVDRLIGREREKLVRFTSLVRCQRTWVRAMRWMDGEARQLNVRSPYLDSSSLPVQKPTPMPILALGHTTSSIHP